MKILLLLLFFPVAALFGQEVVYDPQHTAAVIENNVVRSSAESTHNQYLGQINNDVTDININVSSVVLAQKTIYSALSNVNSALKDGIAVKNMAVTVEDMVSYLEQCLELAKEQPYLLLFAQAIEQQMQVRALALVSDVSGFVLKEGDNVLADYNARDHLLSKVIQQLQILDGLAFGAWRAMYWAKERGIIASLNPYQGFINKDKLFVANIIANIKYLKQ